MLDGRKHRSDALFRYRSRQQRLTALRPGSKCFDPRPPSPKLIVPKCVGVLRFDPSSLLRRRNFRRIAVVGSVYLRHEGIIYERHQRCIHQGQRRDATCHCRSASSRSLSWSIQSWAALCVAKSQVVQDDSPCLVSST
jgi:hypothetical protein